MTRLVVTLLIGFTGFAVLAWGAFAGLPWVSTVIQDHGTSWGMAALATVFAVCAVVAVGLWRLQDRLAGPRGRPVADQLYCQRCGTPARLDAQFCAACGHTRLALRRPDVSPP